MVIESEREDHFPILVVSFCFFASYIVSVLFFVYVFIFYPSPFPAHPSHSYSNEVSLPLKLTTKNNKELMMSMTSLRSSVIMYCSNTLRIPTVLYRRSSF
jgi:E3 ubiquitin-protein ligase DOA10